MDKESRPWKTSKTFYTMNTNSGSVIAPENVTIGKNVVLHTRNGNAIDLHSTKID